MYTEYSSNNSGGSWWLKDEDWHALEDAGWVVVWAWMSEKFTDDGDFVRGPGGAPVVVPVAESNSRFMKLKGFEEGERWLGALATRAYRPGLSLMDAVDEWGRVTSGCPTDTGCPCCGEPHHFTEYNDAGGYVCDGPSTEHVTTFTAQHPE